MGAYELELFGGIVIDPHIKELCQLQNPYEVNHYTDQLFVNAMVENIKWHQKKSQFYKRLLEERNFEVESLQSIDDLKKIPYVLANFFKKYEVKSIDDSDVYLHLTSSGTTGLKSQMFFDEWSIKSAQRMVEWIFKHNNWISDEASNYLLYTYQPKEGSKLGTAYTDNFLCQFSPVHSVEYALKYMGEDQGSEHKFDLFGCINTLYEFAAQEKPVRIFGFPAFLYFTLSHMKKCKMEPLKLNPDSLVFLGGGWKGHQEEAISKDEFYKLAEEMLGIPNERLRDGFGSVEHCIPYIECDHHQFHIPVWSQVLIRDVKTLEVLPDGQEGYLNFISPYMTSVPANNVLMGDLAVKYPGKECPCQLETPYFVVKGRAGVSKNKSCAITASELLGEFQ